MEYSLPESVITLRAALGNTVHVLSLGLCVCGRVCYNDNSKFRASILTKLGLLVKVPVYVKLGLTHNLLCRVEFTFGLTILSYIVIMDARSAMRPCYILPMFFYIFLCAP